jgi:hypothetical protein
MAENGWQSGKGAEKADEKIDVSWIDFVGGCRNSRRPFVS